MKKCAEDLPVELYIPGHKAGGGKESIAITGQGRASPHLGDKGERSETTTYSHLSSTTGKNHRAHGTERGKPILLTIPS
jgi:hypothetical protein